MTTTLPVIDYTKREGAKRSGVSVFRFPLVAFDQLTLDSSPAYLVRGIIPREGLVVIWGPPKCGKSFWAFNLVSHIALGWEYRGRRVKRGPVVYIACEGERGLAARAEAFRRKCLSEDGKVPGFYLLGTRLDIAADQDGDVCRMSAARKTKAFDAAAWLDQCLKARMGWTIEPTGHLWHYMPARSLDPAAHEAWDRLSPDFDRYRPLIVAEISRRVGPAGGSVFAQGTTVMHPETAAGLARNRASR